MHPFLFEPPYHSGTRHCAPWLPVVVGKVLLLLFLGIHRGFGAATNKTPLHAVPTAATPTEGPAARRASPHGLLCVPLLLVVFLRCGPLCVVAGVVAGGGAVLCVLRRHRGAFKAVFPGVGEAPSLDGCVVAVQCCVGKACLAVCGKFCVVEVHVVLMLLLHSLAVVLLVVVPRTTFFCSHLALVEVQPCAVLVCAGWKRRAPFDASERPPPLLLADPAAQCDETLPDTHVVP